MAEPLTIRLDLNELQLLQGRLNYARRMAARTGGVRFVQVGREGEANVMLRIQATTLELGCEGDPRMRAHPRLRRAAI